MRFLQVSCISEISKNYKKLRKSSVFFVLSRAWDNEKNLSPLEESNLRPSYSALRYSTTELQRVNGERGLLRSSYDTRPFFFLCSTLEKQDEKHISLLLYRAQNLPSFLFLFTNMTLSTLLILAIDRTRVI